ncbi:hypothetical protein ACHAWF_012768 [Thalassiosira exigua]
MGNCLAPPPAQSDRRRRQRRNLDHLSEPSDPCDRRWSDRGPDGRGSDGGENDGSRHRVLPSMARVGSRVFKESSREADLLAAGKGGAGGSVGTTTNGGGAAGGGRGRGALKEHKASTYEHVHEIVERGIEGRRASNENGGGTCDGAGGGNNGDACSGRVGLTNLGNTCFMNSSLQCLSNTVPLTDYFLGYDYRAEINRENFLGTGGALVTSYAELTKHLWLGSGPSHDPRAFKADLSKFAPQFEGYEQQDAQELLAFLLDGIHEDLNRVKVKPYVEDEDCDGADDEGDAVAAWSHYLRRNQSIVVDLFQGQLRNTMRCRRRMPDGRVGCGRVSVRFDPFMYLSLPVSDRCETLDDCLELFCEEELLAGDDRWRCPSCEERVEATKKIDLFMLPPILIVHLKRFEFGTSGLRSKIDRPVTYPLVDWDLSRAKKSRRGIDPLYDLYAVSHHQGNVGFGHYTAHAKNRFDGEWYRYNDARCSRADPDREDLGRGASAYCLFYNRVERVPSRNGDGVEEKKTVVRRQSAGRPELWPHLQRAKAKEWKSARTSTGAGAAPPLGGSEVTDSFLLAPG